METYFRVKHKILQNDRFQTHPKENKVSLAEKCNDEIGQRRLQLLITEAMKTNWPRLQSCANESEHLSESCRALCLSEQSVQ